MADIDDWLLQLPDPGEFTDDSLFERHLDTEATEPDPPTPLTDGRQARLTAGQIIYQSCIPDYPQTSPDGIAYVIEKRSLAGQDLAKLANKIQYSCRRMHPPKQSSSSFLGGPVLRYRYQCSGVSVCNNLFPQLEAMRHTSVDENLWASIKRFRNIGYENVGLPQRAAMSLYFAVRKLFEQDKACQQPLPTCALRYGKYQQPNVSGQYLPYLACVHASQSASRDHYHRGLVGITNLDTDFLERLVNDQLDMQEEGCAFITGTSTRRPYCEITHPQGRGKMTILPCNVIFDFLVPTLPGNQYIILCSHGEHSHPPPPPAKPAPDIMADIVNLVREMRQPDITTTMFLQSSEMKQLCNAYGVQSVSQIKASFGNMDRLAAVVQKQRLFYYPEGTDINGVIHKYNLEQNQQERYIQKIIEHDDLRMVICCYDAQLALLMTLRSFEVDMSYKRVRDKTITEIVFATLLQDHGKVVTLVRVFVNKDTFDMYQRMFTEVFALVKERLGRDVHFHHLHNQGFHALIMDMDWKQMKGFGLFLESIDPENRPWKWHLIHCLLLCHVHFLRGIDQCIGTSNEQSELRDRMQSLMTCVSYEAYVRLCDLLQANEAAHVRDWARNKKNPIIAAGLNKNCSAIASDWYDSIRNHTNAAEQTHHKSYAWGRQGSFLGAIINSQSLDQRDMDQLAVKDTYGISHKWRDVSLETRYYNSLIREQSRQRKRLQQDILEDSELPTNASSSGYVRPPNRSNSRTSSRASSRASSRGSRGPRRRQSTQRLSSPSPSLVSQHSISTLTEGQYLLPPSSAGPAQSLRRVASANLQDIYDREEQIRIEKRMLELQREEIELRRQRRQHQIAD